MTLPRSVAQVLNEHVTLEVEGIDRIYLNVSQPRLPTERGVAAFFRFHRGETFASAALMAPMSTAFVAAVEDFVEREQIPMLTFAKGQRKDDVAKQYQAQFPGQEGIVFVGKAQEKTPVFRTEKPTSTSMASTRISARSSSSSAPTSPIPPSSASTATSMSNGNWPRKGSPSRRWTMAS
jgi:hypothetical protein